MKVVVADTSPLNYLIQIGEVGILSELYGWIIIPAEVFVELSDSEAPIEVRDWARQLPPWVEVRPVAANSDLPGLADLDAGELAAINLAKSEAEALLLIDDAAGRREGNRLGLATIGTLGVLRLAAVEELIELRAALGRLMQTNFRAPGSLIRQLIAEDENRRQLKGF